MGWGDSCNQQECKFLVRPSFEKRTRKSDCGHKYTIGALNWVREFAVNETEYRIHERNWTSFPTPRGSGFRPKPQRRTT